MLQEIVKNFLRGLLIVVPVAATAWIIYLVFTTVDNWVNVEALLDRRIPGAGVLITVVAIFLVGLLTRTLVLRWVFGRVDSLLAQLPLVKILYTSIRDLTHAFVGEQKRFDRPVAITPGSDPELLLLGFLTRDDLDVLGLPGFASVYVPQSYNFAGNLVLVPRERIRPLTADSTGAMKFIVSGGVSGAPSAAVPSNNGDSLP
jgi:uncharacterized membrane protein